MALPQFDTEQLYKGFYRTRALNDGDKLLLWLQEYIDRFYPKIILDLIGAGDFEKIENQASLQGKFTDLFDGSCWTNGEGKRQKQNGLKDACIGLLYFYFVRDSFTVGEGGHAMSAQDTSTTLSLSQHGDVAKTRWNESINSLHAICRFVSFFSSVTVDVISSIELVGQYQINIPSTTYLYDGDEVIINNKKYVISGLVADTSFIIDETDSGLDFSGSSVNYSPFKDYPITYQNAPYGDYTVVW